VNQTHQHGTPIELRFSRQDKVMPNPNLMLLPSLKVDMSQLGMVNGVTIDMLFCLLQELMTLMLMLVTIPLFMDLVNLLWIHQLETSWHKMVILTSLVELLQTSGEELKTSKSHRPLENQCSGLYLKQLH
jgi:hypothetical protein